MNFTPVDQVEWVHTGILQTRTGFEYAFDLPRPLADWDVWDYWERERVHSMRAYLRPGMTLFDVGAEQGWCSLIYASMVGPENMVLIEPTPEFWPNIRATWQRNYEKSPRACYEGLISDKTRELWHLRGFVEPWPVTSNGPLVDRNSYRYVHTNDGSVNEITLDDFTARTGILPDSLTIDVEGAELLVLRGAERILRDHHPIVWASVHPDLMQRDYGTDHHEVHDFMTGIGYERTHLATDHEEHWLYR